MKSLNKFIPYGKQSISEEDIENVISALKSPLITQGPLCQEFESKISKKIGSQYGVAVNSATSALHIACIALGLKKGDILWTSPISFVASANCALYCGAKIDFVDIDPNSGLMSIEKLKEKLSIAALNNKLPKIIIPVHLTGSSCNMEEIFKLSKKYNFKIIEDASHAIGGKYKAQYVGNCKYSSVCVFSFHPVKIITTGEGGFASTNDKIIFEKMVNLRSHGIIRNIKDFKYKSNGPWSYEQQELGFNYRLTELQAALGISQLKRLDNFVIKRNILFERYKKLIEDLPIKLLEIPNNVYSSVHLAVIRLDNKEKSFHKFIFEKMQSHNIGVQLHYQPIHLHPFYQNLNFKKNDFPNAELYSQNAISIPLYPDLTEEEQIFIVSILSKYLQQR